MIEICTGLELESNEITVEVEILLVSNVCRIDSVGEHFSWEERVKQAGVKSILPKPHEYGPLWRKGPPDESGRPPSKAVNSLDAALLPISCLNKRTYVGFTMQLLNEGFSPGTIADLLEMATLHRSKLIGVSRVYAMGSTRMDADDQVLIPFLKWIGNNLVLDEMEEMMIDIPSDAMLLAIIDESMRENIYVNCHEPCLTCNRAR
jgi:hypothetical protein